MFRKILMVGVLALPFAVIAAPAQAAPKVYKNCAEVNKVFPYGLAAKGAKDKVNTKTHYALTKFTTNTAVYNANKKLDTDKDKIACELPRPRACSTLNATYKNGVGKSGAKDKVTGTAKPVTTFKVHSVLYSINTHLDRDKDGIACEKH